MIPDPSELRLLQLEKEMQALRGQIVELNRLVYGADNPQSLNVQTHLFNQRFQQVERQFRHVETEIEGIASAIQDHIDHHSELILAQQDRNWQTKNGIWVAVAGAVAAGAVGLLIGLIQHFSPKGNISEPIDEYIWRD